MANGNTEGRLVLVGTALLDGKSMLQTEDDNGLLDCSQLVTLTLYALRMPLLCGCKGSQTKVVHVPRRLLHAFIPRDDMTMSGQPVYAHYCSYLA